MLIGLIAAGFAGVTTSSTLSIKRCFQNSYENISTIPFYRKDTQNNSESQRECRYIEYQKLGGNYFKLLSYADLKKGWNGYDAKIISPTAIKRTKSLLLGLEFQPKIFPTGRGSVQVECYIDDSNLIEIEVFYNRYSVYSVDNGNEYENEHCTLADVKARLMNFHK